MAPPASSTSSSSSSHSHNNKSHHGDSSWLLRLLLLVIAPPTHVAVRIALANRMPLMDCDEPFNYWEPLHFLLYGSGYQTWEYSNVFALRTYAYLMPLLGVSKVYQRILLPLLLQLQNVGGISSWLWPLLTGQQQQVGSNINDDKLALFLLLRASLGAWMSWAELSFVKAIYEAQVATDGSGQKASTKQQQQQQAEFFPLMVALVTQILLLTSAGMGHAAAALLPSSTLMGLWLFAAAAFLRHQHTWFILFAVTATLAVGWPFGVILFVPLGLRVLIREYCYHHQVVSPTLVMLFLKIGVIVITIQGVVMWIDYQHYGRWVSPVWNILVYNTHGGGDQLYGVEPLSYYVKNLLLNFNYVAVIGMAAAVAAPLLFWGNELLYLLLPMVLWLFVVVPRPHKEERFLYPIYPALCLGAAMLSVRVVQVLTDRVLSIGQKKSAQPRTMVSAIIVAFIWGPAALLSGSRIAALMKYYSAPLSLYAKIPAAVQSSHQPNTPAMVCTCGEWYRFPSSFYLPNDSVAFGFASSMFGGQLPQPFTQFGSGKESASIQTFNDKNEPEPASYISFEECDFLVELSTSMDSCTESIEAGYEWQAILQEPFLNADATSTLHRSLYIPQIHEKAIDNGQVHYTEFALYAKRKTAPGSD